MRIIALSLLTYVAALVVASPAQLPLRMDAENGGTIASRPKKLHGRFLHITDMHPDPFYTPRASTSKSCHGKKAKKKKKEAGYWGTPVVECDSPLRLTNFTLDYLGKNWADEVDFVIWTGDNARHDEDHKIPRTPNEIFDLNRQVAAKMEKIFLKRGIPVVPSLGNNDIWRPNKITNEFTSIWSAFVPFPQRQVFQRGAYYSVEVIPGRVAVISLNSIYFYDSNKAVGGCQYRERDDPGNLQLDWLEVQLRMYRERNMVYLSGHIPPSPGMYFPECYVRYVELSLRFQDTILGHLYGFLFVEEVDLDIIPEDENGKLKIRGAHDGLYKTLLTEFAHLPKEDDEKKLDGLAVVNVAPSVVPNPFVPSFRIFSYNVSAEALMKQMGKKRNHGHRRGRKGDKDKHCKEEPYRSSWKCHLNEPWYSDSDAPSRKSQAFTPLGYAQYYMPDISEANKTHPPHFELEYVTYPVSALQPGGSGDEKEFVYPVPLQHLPRSLRAGNRTSSRYAPYEIDDLTIGSWVGLGRRLGHGGHGKLRRQFRKYMYVGG
ncbi:Endopolyphosphatase [Leucoagaricus sp. SymC.cos]|nr:Endopolyphosphatase [Leucoagaricus sp. SymC.cos]